MKSEGLGKYKSLYVRDLRQDNKFLIYLGFVVISTLLWFLIVLSENYITTVSYPVAFSKFPSNKLLVNKLPNHLSLEVDAYGFDLLRYKISRSLVPLKIELDKNTLFKTRYNDSRYFILTKYAQNLISAQISDNIKIISIQPDSIFFDFSEKVSKRVAVKSNILYQLQKQYVINGGINCIPDSVTITGAKSVLDTVSYVYTEQYNFNIINEDIDITVELEPINGCDFLINEVGIQCKIEKFTQGSFEIPIEITNAPDGLILKPLPNKVQVLFKAALSNYLQISPKQFNIIIDCNLLDRTKDKSDYKIKLNLIKSPVTAFDIEIVPEYVDFLFDRK